MESKYYIEWLLSAKKKWPYTRVKNAWKEYRMWKVEWYNVIDEQIMLYQLGKGRLQAYKQKESELYL